MKTIKGKELLNETLEDIEKYRIIRYKDKIDSLQYRKEEYQNKIDKINEEIEDYEHEIYDFTIQ